MAALDDEFEDSGELEGEGGGGDEDLKQGEIRSTDVDHKSAV